MAEAKEGFDDGGVFVTGGGDGLWWMAGLRAPRGGVGVAGGGVEDFGA